MFSWLSNAWRVPELRRRVLFSAAMLTGCEYVRNGPIGIASFDVEPRCLPMRM